MTLTEFLLARIAEDEAETFELVPYDCEPDCCAPAGWVGHRCLICDTTRFGGSVSAITEIAREHAETIHRRSRVLAECEAKRRIVFEAYHSLRAGAQRGERTNSYEMILKFLGMPYVDHPDYREEWLTASRGR